MEDKAVFLVKGKEYELEMRFSGEIAQHCRADTRHKKGRGASVGTFGCSVPRSFLHWEVFGTNWLTLERTQCNPVKKRSLSPSVSPGVAAGHQGYVGCGCCSYEELPHTLAVSF